MLLSELLLLLLDLFYLLLLGLVYLPLYRLLVPLGLLSRFGCLVCWGRYYIDRVRLKGVAVELQQGLPKWL